MLREQSVLLVTSDDSKIARFGTSFFIGRDSQSRAYVVTCAHVVRDVGGAELVNVGGRRARLVLMGSPDGADDIAVLEADVPGHVLPLALARAPSEHRACTVIGYRKLFGDLKEARPIDGVFGSAILTTGGRPVGAWNLETNETVPEGYSGSPVFNKVTGEVIGVAAVGFQNMPRAVAIAAQEVVDRWPPAIVLRSPRLTVRDVDFVYVPPGSFAMGTYGRRAKELAEQQNRPAFADEAPRSEVAVEAFYIARYPVTNEQYQEFVNNSSDPVPSRRDDPWSSQYSWDEVSRRFPERLARHPVVLVSWSQARRYCAWLQARLPTEAEWEKCARGREGRTWPWGDDWEADCCNTAEHAAGGTTPVDRYSPRGDSPYGAADMSGNVWEWCSSLNDPYPYRADDGREDMGAQGRRVLRGGAFEQNRYVARCAARNAAHQNECGFTIGFRPAMAPPL